MPSASTNKLEKSSNESGTISTESSSSNINIKAASSNSDNVASSSSAAVAAAAAAASGKEKNNAAGVSGGGGGGGANPNDASNPMKLTLITIEHKIRNLEKRKTKLESYRAIQASGKELSSDQKLAVAKYDAVMATLEFARDLSKQMQQFTKDAEKEQKKQARKDVIVKAQAETAKIREVIIIQNILSCFADEAVRADFLNGENGAVKLEQNEMDALEKLCMETITRRAETSDDVPFGNQAQKAAEIFSMTIDGRPKLYAEITYEHLRRVLQQIQDCGYLDKLFLAPAEVTADEIEVQDEKENWEGSSDSVARRSPDYGETQPQPDEIIRSVPARIEETVVIENELLTDTGYIELHQQQQPILQMSNNQQQQQPPRHTVLMSGEVMTVGLMPPAGMQPAPNQVAYEMARQHQQLDMQKQVPQMADINAMPPTVQQPPPQALNMQAPAASGLPPPNFQEQPPPPQGMSGNNAAVYAAAPQQLPPPTALMTPQLMAGAQPHPQASHQILTTLPPQQAPPPQLQQLPPAHFPATTVRAVEQNFFKQQQQQQQHQQAPHQQAAHQPQQHHGQQPQQQQHQQQQAPPTQQQQFINQQMRPLTEMIGSGGGFYFLQDSELDSPEIMNTNAAPALPAQTQQTVPPASNSMVPNQAIEGASTAAVHPQMAVLNQAPPPQPQPPHQAPQHHAHAPPAAQQQQPNPVSSLVFESSQVHRQSPTAVNLLNHAAGGAELVNKELQQSPPQPIPTQTFTNQSFPSISQVHSQNSKTPSPMFVANAVVVKQQTAAPAMFSPQPMHHEQQQQQQHQLQASNEQAQPMIIMQRLAQQQQQQQTNTNNNEMAGNFFDSAVVANKMTYDKPQLTTAAAAVASLKMSEEKSMSAMPDVASNRVDAASPSVVNEWSNENALKRKEAAGKTSNTATPVSMETHNKWSTEMNALGTPNSAGPMGGGGRKNDWSSSSVERGNGGGGGYDNDRDRDRDNDRENNHWNSNQDSGYRRGPSNYQRRDYRDDRGPPGQRTTSYRGRNYSNSSQQNGRGNGGGTYFRNNDNSNSGNSYYQNGGSYKDSNSRYDSGGYRGPRGGGGGNNMRGNGGRGGNGNNNSNTISSSSYINRQSSTSSSRMGGGGGGMTLENKN